MSGKRYWIAAVTIAATFWVMGHSARAQDAGDRSKQKCDATQLSVALKDRVSGDLNRLAEELSVLVSQRQVRGTIAEKLTGAKQRTAGLHQLLSGLEQPNQQRGSRNPNADQQPTDGQNRREGRSPNEDRQQGEAERRRGEDRTLVAILETVRKIESAMEEVDVATPRLDVKLPVDAHAKAIQNASEVYVAVVPLSDEDQVRTVTAYSNGKRVELDPDTPPETPTLVLVGAEPQSDNPGYPLPQAKEPGQEEDPKRVDDYVGIPWMFIYDDHESWLCGDPEIYVRLKRFRFSTFSVINQRINLPGVNGEEVWYNLGDPNSTYRFVSSSDYAPVVRIEVWEADSGFHGGDDYLGARIINWTQLRFGGYRYFTAGDARFGIDRD